MAIAFENDVDLCSGKSRDHGRAPKFLLMNAAMTFDESSMSM